MCMYSSMIALRSFTHHRKNGDHMFKDCLGSLELSYAALHKRYILSLKFQQIYAHTHPMKYTMPAEPSNITPVANMDMDIRICKTD